jgi:hypothetical protein
VSGVSGVGDALSHARMNAFCLSPAQLALHLRSTPLTPLQAFLQSVFHAAVELERARGALQQLATFTKTELGSEQRGQVHSSDSVFCAVFTLLTDLLAAPAACPLGVHNVRALLSAERERLQLRWQGERRQAKRDHLEQLEAFEKHKANLRTGVDRGARERGRGAGRGQWLSCCWGRCWG